MAKETLLQTLSKHFTDSPAHMLRSVNFGKRIYQYFTQRFEPEAYNADITDDPAKLLNVTRELFVAHGEITDDILVDFMLDTVNNDHEMFDYAMVADIVESDAYKNIAQGSETYNKKVAFEKWLIENSTLSQIDKMNDYDVLINQESMTRVINGLSTINAESGIGKAYLDQINHKVTLFRQSYIEHSSENIYAKLKEIATNASRDDFQTQLKNIYRVLFEKDEIMAEYVMPTLIEGSAKASGTKMASNLMTTGWGLETNKVLFAVSKYYGWTEEMFNDIYAKFPIEKRRDEFEQNAGVGYEGANHYDTPMAIGTSARELSVNNPQMTKTTDEFKPTAEDFRKFNGNQNQAPFFPSFAEAQKNANNLNAEQNAEDDWDTLPDLEKNDYAQMGQSLGNNAKGTGVNTQNQNNYPTPVVGSDKEAGDPTHKLTDQDLIAINRRQAEREAQKLTSEQIAKQKGKVYPFRAYPLFDIAKTYANALTGVTIVSTISAIPGIGRIAGPAIGIGMVIGGGVVTAKKEIALARQQNGGKIDKAMGMKIALKSAAAMVTKSAPYVMGALTGSLWRVTGASIVGARTFFNDLEKRAGIQHAEIAQQEEIKEKGIKGFIARLKRCVVTDTKEKVTRLKGIANAFKDKRLTKADFAKSALYGAGKGAAVFFGATHGREIGQSVGSHINIDTNQIKQDFHNKLNQLTDDFKNMQGKLVATSEELQHRAEQVYGKASHLIATAAADEALENTNTNLSSAAFVNDSGLSADGLAQLQNIDDFYMTEKAIATADYDNNSQYINGEKAHWYTKSEQENILKTLVGHGVDKNLAVKLLRIEGSAAQFERSGEIPNHGHQMTLNHLANNIITDQDVANLMESREIIDCYGGLKEMVQTHAPIANTPINTHVENFGSQEGMDVSPWRNVDTSRAAVDELPEIKTPVKEVNVFNQEQSVNTDVQYSDDLFDQHEGFFASQDRNVEAVNGKLKSMFDDETQTSADQENVDENLINNDENFDFGAEANETEINETENDEINETGNVQRKNPIVDFFEGRGGKVENIENPNGNSDFTKASDYISKNYTDNGIDPMTGNRIYSGEGVEYEVNPVTEEIRVSQIGNNGVESKIIEPSQILSDLEATETDTATVETETNKTFAQMGYQQQGNGDWVFTKNEATWMLTDKNNNGVFDAEDTFVKYAPDKTTSGTFSEYGRAFDLEGDSAALVVSETPVTESEL